MLIEDVNKDIASYSGANNYPKAIEQHGYVFHYLNTDKDRRNIFIATQQGQMIVDSLNKVYYKCAKFKVVALGIAFADEWDFFVKNWNSEGDFKTTPQRERIENIVNACLFQVH